MILLIGMVGVITFNSCKKDDEDTEAGNPSISLSHQAGYTYSNGTASFGDSLKFGVSCSSNGTDNLVNFKVLVNGVAVVDSSINASSFNSDFIAAKGADPQESYQFVITDIAGHSASSTVTITAVFGEIMTFPNVLLGAQANVTEPSFVSYSNNTVTRYYQVDAFNHQSDIDMFCFWENTTSHPDSMKLAAPGSNITGIFTGATAPENYTIKNVTYFVQTTMTPTEFDAIQNDGGILAAYDPNNAFRKVKNLMPGDVCAFKIQSGLYGLLKVTASQGPETGTLTFDIKIQKAN